MHFRVFSGGTDGLEVTRFGRRDPCPIHLSRMNVVFVQCYVSLTIMSPPPRTADRFSKIPMDLQRCEYALISAFGRCAATQPADMEGGDRMTIWLISIAGVIVGVIATDTPITDPKEKLLLGLVLMVLPFIYNAGR